MEFFMRSILRRLWPFLFIPLVLFIFQQSINYLSYDLRGPSQYVVAPLMRLGLAEELARAVYWYVLQIAFSLLLIKLTIRKKFREIGFNFDHSALSLRIIIGFVLIYTVVVAVSWYGLYRAFGVQAIIGGAQTKPLSYMLKDMAVYGLLPGPGEEPLFRVFIIQLLLMTTYEGLPVKSRRAVVGVVVLSSLFFALGHVFVLSLSPLQLKYDVLQLVTATVLGVFYAISYLKTGSILAAVVCHNYSDFIVRVGMYLVLGWIG
jgi:membrane protease YdiL (CAAX protease family)